jgi:hypothetical protein
MLIDNSKNPLLNPIFHANDGTKEGAWFYGFIDPLSIPTVRGLAAEKAKRFVDMNITERTLKELIRQFKIEAKSGDITKAFWIIQEIDYRLEFISEESSLLDLSNVYFMLNEEDPENPSEAMNRKKHAIFAKDSKAKDFFLSIALSIVKRFSEKPEEDILSYLEDTKVMSERIRRYVPEEHLINSMNTSTS